VQDAHHVHAWAPTSGKNVFSAHLQNGSDCDGSDALSSAHDLLREKFGFLLVTLQVEDRCLDETGAEDIDITLDPAKTQPAQGDARQPHGNHARSFVNRFFRATHPSSSISSLAKRVFGIAKGTPSQFTRISAWCGP
jgi:hypothetical protein